LTVDAHEGTVRVSTRQKAQATQVADFLGKEAVRYYQLGYTKLTVVLDNNPNHHKKMKAKVYAYLKTRVKGFHIRFLHTASYSPDLNLAEYMIQLLRKKVTNHHQWSITQLRWRLQNYVRNTQLQTSQQIKNTLNHIFTIISNINAGRE